MYQWLLILIVLIFFIYNFTNVNKECFNVGGNNIYISKNLYLNDVCSKPDLCDGVTCINGSCISGSCICQDGYTGNTCNKLVDDMSCTDDTDCQSNICFYEYDGTKNTNVSGVCKSGSGVVSSLCVHDTKRFLTNNPNDDSVIETNFNSYNPDYFCKENNICIDLSDPNNNQYVQTYNNLYNTDTSDLKNICESFSKSNPPLQSNINCMANLQYGYCKKDD